MLIKHIRERKAHQLALSLDGINKDRKKLEADMRQQAWQALDELSEQHEYLPDTLCLLMNVGIKESWV